MHYGTALGINIVLVVLFSIADGFNPKLILLSIVITSLIMGVLSAMFKEKYFWEEEAIVTFSMYFIILAYSFLAFWLTVFTMFLANTEGGRNLIAVLGSFLFLIAWMFLDDEVEEAIRERVKKPVSELEFKRIFERLVFSLKISTGNNEELLRKAAKIYDRIIEEKLKDMNLTDACLRSDNQLYFLNNHIPKFRMFLKQTVKTIKKEIV